MVPLLKQNGITMVRILRRQLNGAQCPGQNRNQGDGDGTQREPGGRGRGPVVRPSVVAAALVASLSLVSELPVSLREVLLTSLSTR